MAEEWNVEEFYRYTSFIIRLRQRLRASRETSGVPHLIPQQLGTPTEFLDIILRTSASRVTFRLRRDSLYLVGYQMENGQWLEFGRDGQTHLIPGATFLGHGCMYDDLTCAARGSTKKSKDDGGRSLVGIKIGSNSLETAVKDLATTTVYKTRALRLIVVIMTICEAVRFNPILETVATFDEKKKKTVDPGQSQDEGCRIEGWMEDLVHNWGKFSRWVCLSDANPNPENFSFREKLSNVRLPPENIPVSTTFQLVQILGMILSYCYDPEGERIRRMILVDADKDQYCFEGQPLVEVFSVCIDDIHNENPGELYGTIAVNDGFTQLLYNRPRAYAESISPGQNATIVGPNQSIWANRGFTIQFLLTDSEPLWSPDDEVVNDSVSWDAFDFHNVPMYDKLTSQQVKGKHGSATVNYAVLRNASTALVTINLQEGGEDTVEVYGNVVASYSEWNDNPNAKSVLFKRPKDDYLQVRRWQNIPLLKSIVAVPLGSSLKITASLHDYDPIGADDEIAIGTAEFPAEMSGQSSKDITGEDGNRVTVTVSWGEAIAPEGDRGYSLRVIHDEL